MINHFVGLLISPSKQWKKIADMPPASYNSLLLFPCIFALIPAFAWYYGTTHSGWTIGANDDVIRLTSESARIICILFYFTMLGSIATIGYFISWMSETYDANSSLIKGIVMSGLISTPLFLLGAVGSYPLLWLDLLIGVVAISWSIYLLYLGVPILMNIPKERGFLFSSAIVGVSLVIFVGIMVGAIMVWDMGAAPAFTD